jgi:hypothetical protein
MVARFYGFQPSEIESMLFEDLIAYIKAIEVLRAGEKLDEVRVSSYPHMDKGGRERTHRAWHRKAVPDLYERPRNTVTLADVARMAKVRQHGG